MTTLYLNLTPIRNRRLGQGLLCINEDYFTSFISNFPHVKYWFSGSLQVQDLSALLTPAALSDVICLRPGVVRTKIMAIFSKKSLNFDDKGYDYKEISSLPPRCRS